MSDFKKIYFIKYVKMERIEVYKEISSTGKELWEESAKKYTIGIANNLTNAENLNEHIFQDLSTTVKNRMGNCMQEKNERFDDYNKLFNKIIGLYKK
jgi:hypothetical protein